LREQSRKRSSAFLSAPDLSLAICVQSSKSPRRHAILQRNRFSSLNVTYA
jgi:hypothetical protein